MVTRSRFAAVIAFAVLSFGCANLGIAADKSVQDEARELADKIKKATQGGGGPLVRMNLRPTANREASVPERK